MTAVTHRVLESLKLEKAFRIIEPNDKLKTAKSTTKPKHHIYINTSSDSTPQCERRKNTFYSLSYVLNFMEMK